MKTVVPTRAEITLARALLEIRRTRPIRIHPSDPLDFDGAFAQIQSIAASALNTHAAAYRHALAEYEADLSRENTF